MSSAKALLKAVGDAIKQQKFDDAIDKINQVLQKDPNSYQGYGNTPTRSQSTVCYALYLLTSDIVTSFWPLFSISRISLTSQRRHI